MPEPGADVKRATKIIANIDGMITFGLWAGREEGTMPTISKIENSDFDPKRIGEVFAGNSGREITTEGILKGWKAVSDMLDEIGFDEYMMESPLYIRPKK
jgi:hypothetical protein